MPIQPCEPRAPRATWVARNVARAALLLLAAPVALLATPLAAQEFSPKQKTEIESVIKDYLLRNPEVLRDSLIELQKREKADELAERSKVLESSAAVIYDSKNQTVVGNPKGSITLVEFFDYNCGYCRRALSDLNKLIKDFPDLKVVLKEFPVLGPNSLEAAQIASATRAQVTPEKYWDFHQKLFATRGQIGKAQALAAAREVGADVDRIEKDAKAPETTAAIHEVIGLADKLSLSGTPAWILGKEVIVGAVGYGELRGKIENMQKCGKTSCP